ncbi:MAG: serine/threonine-protein kinase [Pseudomonadota bacterium]
MPRSLAKYQILAALGSGGQARTFLAQDPLLNRQVCIKLYHRKGKLSERRLARDEARKLAAIESPRVAIIYDVVASGPWMALVSQYLPGHDLASVLATKGALPVEQALAIVSDIAAALADLRRSKIVHGDLKASNVILDGSGRAYLTDFGAAVLEGEAYLGSSLEAMSPEQLAGAPASLASDFFALGLLLHRMLWGLKGSDDSDRFNAIQLSRGLKWMKPLPGMERSHYDSLEQLLGSLLAIDPAGRPAGTFELREALRELRSALPIPGSPRELLRGVPDVSQPSSIEVIPEDLWQLPWLNRIENRLSNFWKYGTPGVRGLMISVLLIPMALLVLELGKPGPCLKINRTVFTSTSGEFLEHYRSEELTQWLTTMLKTADGNALVLGLGPASDSFITLNSRGRRDICVPESYYTLLVECSERRCELELSKSDWGEESFAQMSVLRDARVETLQNALRQLLQRVGTSDAKLSQGNEG